MYQGIKVFVSARCVWISHTLRRLLMWRIINALIIIIIYLFIFYTLGI